MGFSDSDSDYGRAAISGYVRPSKKRARRNFKGINVNSSDYVAVVDGEGATAVDRDNEEGGFADELNTSPIRIVFGGRDLAHASDQADEVGSRSSGAL